MTDSTLQDRLRDHAKAFDGLLSLIPAKIYYNEDPNEESLQHQGNKRKKRKQSKDEAAAIRRGKLDPDSKLNRNAKEVMDERARNKRKFSDPRHDSDTENDGKGDDDDDDDGDDGNEENWEDDNADIIGSIARETPGQGLKKARPRSSKKQKLGEHEESADNAEAGNPDEDSKHTTLSRSQEHDAVKQESKREKKKSKKEEKKAAKSKSNDSGLPRQENVSVKIDVKLASGEQAQLDSNESALPPESSSSESTAAVDLAHDADTNTNFDTPPEMATATPKTESNPNPKHIKVTANMDVLRARLAAKIEALRAARKADGTNGRPIRTRQELIESRRVKQAQRKAHKQELRRQTKLEEEMKREEALISNSPMSPSLDLEDDAAVASSYSFGRVSFTDGSQLSHDLSHMLHEGGKKKGPSDPKTALIKLQNQKKRLESMDEEKRKDIEEKDVWAAAKKRVQGEKVRNDESILKKTIKRKEQAKKKSEREWKERTKSVDQAMKERQRKRQDNLQKRKDDKAMGKAGRKAGGATKKQARPGFEGSLGLGGGKKR